eukprot:SAG31_NODE_29_length_32663_cov_14.779695_18_plen_99_part_00
MDDSLLESNVAHERVALSFRFLNGRLPHGSSFEVEYGEGLIRTVMRYQGGTVATVRLLRNKRHQTAQIPCNRTINSTRLWKAAPDALRGALGLGLLAF